MPYKIMIATVENTMEFAQKVKNITTLCPSNHTTVCLSKNSRSVIQKYTCTPCLYSIIHNSPNIEGAQVSINC